jgi:hypothetical protein
MNDQPVKHKPPVAVIIVACVFIAAGVFGFIHHAPELFEDTDFINYEALWVLLLRALAVVAGIFLLRGANWSRWLVIGWMAYHTVLGAFHSVSDLLIHLALLVVFAVLLFHPQVSTYFLKKH